MIEIKCFANDTKKCGFTKIQAKQTFGDAIKNGIITMDMVYDKQNPLAKNDRELVSTTKPRNYNMRKKSIINSTMTFLKIGRKMVFNAFESKIFSLPSTKLNKLSRSKNSGQSEQSSN